MHLSTWLSPAATIAVFAVGYYTPSARRRRQMRHAVDRRLYGTAPVKDLNGKPIAPGADGLFAQLDAMQATVNNAALLNGQGDRLVKDIAWLRRTMAEHVKDPEAHR